MRNEDLPPKNTFLNIDNSLSKEIEYRCSSISGGARDGEHSDTSPFPSYTCAKKAKYFRIFLPFNRTNYENSLWIYTVNTHNEKYN